MKVKKNSCYGVIKQAMKKDDYAWMEWGGVGGSGSKPGSYFIGGAG